MKRLSESEYEALALEYEADAPKLSGKPGYLSVLKEKTLLNELLTPDCARIIYAKANALSILPSEVIGKAIKNLA